MLICAAHNIVQTRDDEMIFQFGSIWHSNKQVIRQNHHTRPCSDCNPNKPNYSWASIQMHDVRIWLLGCRDCKFGWVSNFWYLMVSRCLNVRIAEEIKFYYFLMFRLHFELCKSLISIFNILISLFDLLNAQFY